MARTRASVAAKVATGKSSKARCSAPPPPSTNGASAGSSSEKSTRSYSGGNPVCPRETPKWQKPITHFFVQNQDTTNSDNEEEADAMAGSSKSKPKKNVIQSDDEDDQVDKPKNKELDETLELEPLNGEDSHKIIEYYATKDKGQGKNSNKENIDSNAKRNKRSLDELHSTGEDVERNSKKIRVD